MHGIDSSMQQHNLKPGDNKAGHFELANAQIQQVSLLCNARYALMHEQSGPACIAACLVICKKQYSLEGYTDSMTDNYPKVDASHLMPSRDCNQQCLIRQGKGQMCCRYGQQWRWPQP